jgi:TM2 domain-containing membrane protein YozV
MSHEDAPRPAQPASPGRFRWQDLDIFAPPGHAPKVKLLRRRTEHAPGPEDRSLPHVSGLVAICASFVLPGLGSLINGRRTSGALILAAWLVFIPLFFLTVRDFIGLALVPLLAYLWVVGLLDARSSARR